MVAVKENPNLNKSYFEQLTNYLNTIPGSSAALSLSSKVVALANTTINSPVLADASAKLGSCSSVFTLPSLVKKTSDTIEDVKGAVYAKPEEAVKKTIKAVQATSGTVGSWSRAVLLFFKVGILKTVGSVCGTVGTAFSLHNNIKAYVQVIRLEPTLANATLEEKQAFQDDKKIKLMNLVSSVSGVALMILGMVVALPLVFMIVTSIAESILSIGTTLFEQTRPYKLVVS